MNLLFTDEAWEDYCHWQSHDKKLLKKINTLLKEADSLEMRICQKIENRK